MDGLELPIVRPTTDRFGETLGMHAAKYPVDRRRGPTKFTVNIPESYPSQAVQTQQQAQNVQGKPSRWNTLEFKIYGVVFAIVVPIMIWVPIRLSQREHISANSLAVSRLSFSTSAASHPNFPFYRNRLSEGWLFGRQIVSLPFQPMSLRVSKVA